MNPLRAYAKAIVAGILAGLAYMVPVVDDGLLWSEILRSVLIGLTAYATVWRVRNVDVVPEPT